MIISGLCDLDRNCQKNFLTIIQRPEKLVLTLSSGNLSKNLTDLALPLCVAKFSGKHILSVSFGTVFVRNEKVGNSN